MSKKTILIFTGGGLAPALNPTLYGAITQAKKQGFKILGGMYGWASLLDNGQIVDLTKLNLEPIKNIGGTFLRSSRTNPFKIKDGLLQLEGKIKEYKIDYLIAIGGDDTLGAALKLFKNRGIKIVGIPKTIDNDLSGTYWTPGFPSAAYDLINFCREIREDAAYTLSRIFIIETLGGQAGWLTAASIYGQADIILPPEKKVSLKKLLKILDQRYQKNGNFATVVISKEVNFIPPLESYRDEQKDDSFGVKRREFVCLSLREKIKQALGVDTRALYPGNFLETGRPIKLDRDFAIKLGQKAIELIKKEKFGSIACLKRPNWKKKKIIVDSAPLDQVVGKGKYRNLDETYFDFNNFLPKKKFLDYMEPILGKYKPNKKNVYLQLLPQLKKYVS